MPDLYKKTCSKCRKEKKLTEFSKGKHYKLGVLSICKECKKKYYQEHYCEFADIRLKYRIKAQQYRKKKRDIIFDKLGAYCRNCGYKESTYAIELHHMTPSQKEHERDSLSLWMRQWTVEKTLAKLQRIDFVILCRNCHSLFHGGVINESEWLFNNSWHQSGESL